MSDTERAPATHDEPEKKLSDEDLARVAEYLNSPIHQTERKPFRPWLFLAFLMILVTGLSALSLLYAMQHGIPLG